MGGFPDASGGKDTFDKSKVQGIAPHRVGESDGVLEGDIGVVSYKQTLQQYGARTSHVSS